MLNEQCLVKSKAARQVVQNYQISPVDFQPYRRYKVHIYIYY
jgi:hypothetical protein